MRHIETYSVYHYCPLMPCFYAKNKGLTLDRAKELADFYTKRKKREYKTLNCCQYFVQKEN